MSFVDPTLRLPFARGLLDPRLSFSRTSTGAYFDKSGVLKSAAVGQPRIDQVPATGVGKGLLIEETRTNLCLYSEAFDNAAHTKTRCSVSANALAAPDGATTADKVVEDSSASTSHYVQQSLTITANTVYAVSVFAKAGERSIIALFWRDGADGVQAYFDLSAGSVASSNAFGSGSDVAAAIEDCGGGWYRCKLTGKINASTTTGLLQIYLTTSTGSVSYSGDGSSGLYLWGAQVSVGSFAASYTATTSAAASRGSEVANIATSGFGFNATEGTLVVRARALLGGSGTAAAVALSDGGTSNMIAISVLDGSADAIVAQVYDGGTLQASLSIGTATNDTEFRVAFAYKANDFAACMNGGTVQTDSAGTVPTVTLLDVGRRGSTAYLNGWIADVLYFPRRLPDATLQALTA